ncbi:MAG: efflux RND transporter permease subunit, partial [Kiritimatiellae bacterium]|nr:efflux RND transporter permease subunit [Kiritimatiellia bacterium]
RLTALVLLNIPVALTGGVLLTRLMLNTASIATLVGYIAVGGIALRNAIMMVSHILHILRHEGEDFDMTMIRRGALERLSPVLMTALTAGFALLPLVFAQGESGKEILNPVAVVIVGGLISSTFLGLGLTPTLFYHFCRGAAEKSIRLDAPATA